MLGKLRYLSLLLYMLIIGCSTFQFNYDVVVTKDVNDGVIGVFKTKQDLVLIKNLPVYGEEPDLITASTSSLYIHGSEVKLDTMVNSCANCLDKKRMPKPLRVEYVPKGSEFQILERYKLVSKLNEGALFYSGPSTRYVYQLKDKDGRLLEASPHVIEHALAQEKEAVFEAGNIEYYLNSILADLTKSPPVQIEFCGRNTRSGVSAVHPIANLDSFIEDFTFTDDISYQRAEQADCSYPDSPYLVSFNSSEAVITTLRYAKEWNIYGNWKY